MILILNEKQRDKQKSENVSIDCYDFVGSILLEILEENSHTRK